MYLSLSVKNKHRKLKKEKNDFNQEDEGLFNENHKSVEKKFEDIEISGKTFHASGSQELRLSKCPHYLKPSTHSLGAIPINV